MVEYELMFSVDSAPKRLETVKITNRIFLLFSLIFVHFKENGMFIFRCKWDLWLLFYSVNISTISEIRKIKENESPFIRSGS